MKEDGKILFLLKGAVSFGLMLLLFSILPWESWVSQKMWTPADAKLYKRITLEYHQSAYQRPARTGLNQDQLTAHNLKLQERTERLRNQLENSVKRPHTWKIILRWSGLILLLTGGLGIQKNR